MEGASRYWEQYVHSEVHISVLLSTLHAQVLSMLVFLSTRYSEERPVRPVSYLGCPPGLNVYIQWSSPIVYVPIALSVAFSVAFIVVELWIAPEPVLAPFLLRQKIPVLVGVSNFLVATCNFTVMYNFPTWFQTVLLTSASEAGKARFRQMRRHDCSRSAGYLQVHI